ncbi:MAG: trehalose-phosphatase [Thermaurantiacus sp.]
MHGAPPALALAAPPPPDPRRDALFLDLDGTLANIAPTPEEARLHPEAAGLLPALVAAFRGRVAVVSGRSIATLDRMLPPAAIAAGLALAGTHGLELRMAGTKIIGPAPAPGLPPAAAALQALAVEDTRLRLEEKGLSLALHYRAAPEREAELRGRAADIAGAHGLALQTGKMVVELRTPGADKGAAIRQIMQSPPFAGAMPRFIGDDDTDEAGFAAAATLGGHGIRVGPAPQTVAAYGLPDVAAVAAWLAQGLPA